MPQATKLTLHFWPHSLDQTLLVPHSVNKHDALKCMAKTISEMAPVHNKTVDEQVREDAKIEEIAEKKVLEDELGMAGARNRLPKLKLTSQKKQTTWENPKTLEKFIGAETANIKEPN